MEDREIYEALAVIREDVAEIKQKLKTDYDMLRNVVEQVTNHEIRLTQMETTARTSAGTLTRVALALFNLITLGLAIFALLKK